MPKVAFIVERRRQVVRLSSALVRSNESVDGFWPDCLGDVLDTERVCASRPLLGDRLSSKPLQRRLDRKRLISQAVWHSKLNRLQQGRILAAGFGSIHMRPPGRYKVRILERFFDWADDYRVEAPQLPSAREAKR